MSESRMGIGQHRAPNHSPTGLNSGQRESVKNPASVTPLSYEEAHRILARQSVNVGPAHDKGDK
jgi:hypothetical protein